MNSVIQFKKMPYQFDWKNNRRFDINLDINSHKHARMFALGLIDGAWDTRIKNPGTLFTDCADIYFLSVNPDIFATFNNT